MTLLVRGADVDGHRVDVRLARGCVAEVAPALPRAPGEEVLDAAGGALLPGLTDHHLHLHALAAAQRSVACGPPAVHDASALVAALGAARDDEHGWVRGIGYAERVAGDLDAAGLDRLHARRPVRLQHRSGALWIVNSRAAAALGLADADHPGVERDTAGTPTGRLWRADDWLRSRLPRTRPPDLREVGRTLLRSGVTAVTDATPDLDAGALGALAGAVAGGALPQRLHLLGLPLGTHVPDGITAGPYKIVLADSGLPTFDDLVDRIRAAHAHGRGVAVHCVTREALVLLLGALEEAGPHPQDRIEHAALVPAELIAELARRRLRVVTQPGFLAHRGDDYLRDVPRADQPDLYRCATLVDAGVPVALSTDAPYGPVDPWAAVTAAVTRTTPDGRVVGAAERLPPAAALAGFLAGPEDPGGPPTRVRPGVAADLVLLHAPLAEVLRSPSADAVRAVVRAGVIVLP